ncbi:MAG: TetR/AcrR family transcriptional regulator [Phycisphaeraceae bacterium]
MTRVIETSSVRDRILATASDLFYRQGYRATGVNQVIAASGVAKASFYSHFPSKDDLLYAYLAAAARQDLDDLHAEVEARSGAKARFFAPLEMLVPWFESSDYRGCPFQNIVAEAPPSDPRVRTLARAHRDNVRTLLRTLAEDVLNQRPPARRPAAPPLDPDALAEVYQLLLEGAIATAVAYRTRRPVDKAIQTLERLLEA